MAVHSPKFDEIRHAAQTWVVRHDRGLSAQEQAEFTRWLAARPAHQAAWLEAGRVWRLLVAPSPSPEKARAWWRARGFRRTLLGLEVVAAALILAAFYPRPAEAPVAAFPIAVTEATRRPESRILRLRDGSIVHLDQHADIEERYSTEERRLRLLGGEAIFEVAKDPGRPFVVQAGTMEVCALGTVFNVHLTAQRIEVAVDEGRVQVAPRGLPREITDRDSRDATLLVAGQKMVLAAPGRAEVPVVSEMTGEERSASFVWGHSLVRLGGATLKELADRFHQRTGHRLIIEDRELQEIRIGGRFPEDDVEGFIRVLEANWSIQSERLGPRETLLRARR